VADLPEGPGAGEPDESGGPGAEPPEEHRADGLDLARSQMLGTAGSSTTPARRLPRTTSDAAKRKAFRRRGGGRGEPQLSGAYPDGRDPQALTSELGRLISDRGWALDLRVRGVFGRWAEIVGPEIGAHSTPESLTDGTLVVRTDSSAWATQLKLLAATVVKRLNEELGHGTVIVVEVLGPHAPSWKHGRRKAPGSRGPRDTYG
jgi:predicted nucleic acid-binding Zn ribbon protein